MLRYILYLFCVVVICSERAELFAQTESTEFNSLSSPWGVSASASSFRNHADWFPKMQAAGIHTVRLFPEWRTFESKTGTWNWEEADALVNTAIKHRMQIHAVLMGSHPTAKKIHEFPVEQLKDWSNYITQVVSRYKNNIKHWEVWNEGNGGFNDSQHTTRDYAKLAVAAYNAAKKADPAAQVGLSVASFDAPYLQETIRAMQEIDGANHFDYLCVHPYEIADGLSDTHGEIPFLWMSHSIREMLKKAAPDQQNVPIWITEVGRKIENKPGRTISEQEAAASFAKLYTMALAQKIAKIEWFEAQDPAGEEAGFGLINRNGESRPAYKTLSFLTQHLGKQPEYVGWLALGETGQGYGFVFRGERSICLVAWMPTATPSATIAFKSNVNVLNLVTGDTQVATAEQAFALTNTPILVLDLPGNFVEQARQNAKQFFPWGGNFANHKTVSYLAGAEQPNQGVFQVHGTKLPRITFADGTTGIVLPGDIGHPVSFYVHPSFANFQTQEYYVRVTARRLGTGNVGMNLLYELADSQGRSPYTNAGQWFGLSASDQWQTYTWHVKNACFSKIWGYDITIRPEQSIPCVIGKVEVSTEPFKK